MGIPVVVICIDGLDPEYLESCEVPILGEMGSKGFKNIGRCLMPSVTNVNNVSIVTGTYPVHHGIASNFLFVRGTGEGIYMESSEYIRAETIFQRAECVGKNSLLVTSKDKLRTLLGDGATMSISSEYPPDWIVDEIGLPSKIYSLEVNGWSIDAARVAMTRKQYDVVYVSTTDFAMHMYGPDEPESQEHLTIIDDAIGRLLETHCGATVFVTADHGMSPKNRMVDLGLALVNSGLKGEIVPIIKDRYIRHHSNLGGCVNVYMESGPVSDAVEILRGVDGVEDALIRDQAAAIWMLPEDRIGDIVVTGEADVVFGNPEEVELPLGLRSHASGHELRIPIIGYNGEFDVLSFQENRDIGRYVFETVFDSDLAHSKFPT